MHNSDEVEAGPRKRGPKPLRPTKQTRNMVALSVAAGFSEEKIAAQLGICRNTLREHFLEELTFGRERKMAENLQRLERAAAKGNVTAMKHLDSRFSVAAAAAEFDAPEPRQPKLGKKEEAAIAATTAGEGSDWGDDLQVPGARPN